MNLYLSGPMSGCPDANHAVFNQAAKELRAQGYVVFNPAEIDGGSKYRERSFYMLACLSELTKIRGDENVPFYDFVVQLPDWDRSVGAQLEMQVACEIGIRLRTIQRFLVHANESEEYSWNPADRDW